MFLGSSASIRDSKSCKGGNEGDSFPLMREECINQGELHPAGSYVFKVNNRNTRARYEICSELTIKTPELRHWRRSDVFIVNFEHILYLVLVFLLLTLNR